jgi:NAD(P)-dependent dehydrogenase (short-subunit alcohol dehydrogenase family)
MIEPMELGLTGARALVTGAAGGIGRAAARALVAEGCHVALLDRDAASIEALATEVRAGGGSASAHPCDVTDEASVDAAVRGAGELDVVIGCAGISGPVGTPLGATALADWDAVFAVNVGGVLNGLRAFVPPLLASGRPANILITASLAGLAGFGGIGAYGPSKHTVVAVAEQAALSLVGTAITVTVLCPSLVRTGMSEIGDDPLDVADAALAATARGQFVLTPPEWHGAIVQRAERMVSGEQPRSAVPGRPSPGD